MLPLEEEGEEEQEQEEQEEQEQEQEQEQEGVVVVAPATIVPLDCRFQQRYHRIVRQVYVQLIDRNKPVHLTNTGNLHDILTARLLASPPESKAMGGFYLNDDDDARGHRTSDCINIHDTVE